MKPKSKEKRLALLRAAFAVVTERGYSDTKVEDIAQHAGVAKGTVYLYFRDKPAIYIGLVDWLLEQALAIMADICREPLSPRRKLERIFEVWSQGLFSRPAVVALLSMENVHQTNTVMRRFRKHVLPHIQELTDAVARIILAGIEAGEFRPVEPRLAALLFMNAFRACIYVLANRLPIPDPSRSVRELYFSGVLARRDMTESPFNSDRVPRPSRRKPRSSL
jgi:AcrR family transcriptional regulator